MTHPSDPSAPARYRVVRPPAREDGSGQNVMRSFGVSGSTAGSRHLSMAYGEVPVGAISDRHHHPFETAVFIIAGTARAYFGARDEECADVEAGDFVFIPGGLPHKTENIGGTPIRYVLARAAPEDEAIAAE